MSVRNMLKVVMSLLTVFLIAITLAITTAHAARLHQSVASQNLPYTAGFNIPFYVCQSICTGLCVCTRAHPCIATCGCVQDPTKEEAAAAAIAAQQMPKVKSDWCLVPYAECSDKCPGGCVCSLIWPPPEHCFCDPRSSSTDEEVQVKGNGKSLDEDEEYSGVIPYTECIKTCDHCACTLKWPPESNVCVCIHNDKPAAAELEANELHKKLELLAGPVEKIKGGGFIPYPECIAKCDRCTTCTRNLPIEESFCICQNYTTSTDNSAELEANELHKKLELLAGPVEKIKGGGFIPYPECIAKCDRCTTCTRNLPIEASFCICQNDNMSTDNSKKQTIKSSADVTGGGDDKKMVLWTKAKMDQTMTYRECMNTCDVCACTLPYPPELARCICITPKHDEVASGKALPV